MQTWCLPTDLSFCCESPVNAVLSDTSFIPPLPYSVPAVRHFLGGTRFSPGFWLHLQWRAVLYQLLCPSQLPHQCPCFFLTSILLVLLLCFLFQLCLLWPLHSQGASLLPQNQFFLVTVLTTTTVFLISYFWRYEDACTARNWAKILLWRAMNIYIYHEGKG